MSGTFKIDIAKTVHMPRPDAVPHHPLPSEDVLAAVLAIHGATPLDWVLSGVSFVYPFTANQVGKHFGRVVVECVGGEWRLYLDGAVISSMEGDAETLTGDPVTIGGAKLHPWGNTGELVLLRALIEFTPERVWTATDDSALALEALVARWREADVELEWSPRGHIIEGAPALFSAPTPYLGQVIVGAHEHAHLITEVKAGDGGRMVLRFKPAAESGAQLWLPIEAGEMVREVSAELGNLTPRERQLAVLEAVNRFLPTVQTQAVWWTCLAAIQHPDTRIAGTGNQFWFTPADFLRLQGYQRKRAGGKRDNEITRAIVDSLELLAQSEFELTIPKRATIRGRFIYVLGDTFHDLTRPGRPPRRAVTIGPHIWGLVREGMFVRVPFAALRMVGESAGGRGGFDKLALYMALMTQARMQHGPIKRDLETVMMEAGLLRPERMQHDRKREERKVSEWLAEFVARGLAGQGTKAVAGRITFVPPDETLAALQGIPKRLPKGRKGRGVPK